MDTLIGILALVSAIFAVIGVVNRRKEASEAHPEVEYEKESLEGVDSWRWRSPGEKIGLEVEDSAGASSISFLYRVGFVEHLMPAGGYLLLVLMLYAVGAGFFRVLSTTRVNIGELVLIVVAMSFFSLLPLAMLEVGNRLIRVELQKDRAIFFLRWGIFWTRKIQFKRHPKAEYSGKLQSSLEMNSDQEQPEYKLFRKIPGLFGSKKRFLLCCDQTQGSWIVGGLNAWNRSKVV